MRDDDDPVLEAAAKLADGLSLRDPEKAAELEQLDSRQLQELENLRRIEQLQAVFRTGDSLGAATEPPRRWGHLEVQESLGQGSFGEVFRAYDPILRRDVALKLRRADSNRSSAHSIAEARRLAGVRHPNVLAVHGSDVHDGRVGLWTDLVEGETLEQLLERHGPFTTGRALELFEPVCRALEAVHRADMVHGDVKASNVMLQRDGRVILMDFGSGESLDENGDVTLTASPLSMAPELFGGAPPSPASDLYAAGVLLFRLLTNRYPVKSATLDDLLAVHRSPTPAAPNWQTIRPGRSVRSLVGALLARTPQTRPTLRKVLARVEWMAKAPSRRLRTAAITSVIAACVVGILATSVGYLKAERSKQTALSALESNAAVTEFLLGLFELGDPDTGTGPKADIEEMLRVGAERVEHELDSQPGLQARLYLTLGDLLRKQGKYPAAQELLNRALKLRSAASWSNAEDVGEVLAALAALAHDQGDYHLAEELYRSVLAKRPSVSPRTDRAALVSALSTAVRAQGRWEAGELLAREAIALYGKPSPSSEYADLLVGLAVPIYQQQHYDEAVQLFNEALEIYRQVNGETHSRVADTLNRLALLEKRRSNYGEAIRLSRMALAIYRRLYGDQHPQVAMLLGNLGSAHARNGELAEALKLLEEAASLQRTVLGDEHPDLAITLNNLAFAQISAGHLQDALAPQREALAIWRGTHGERHPYVSVALGNLGRLLHGLGDLAAAEEATAKALEVRHALKLADDSLTYELEQRLEVIRREMAH